MTATGPTAHESLPTGSGAELNRPPEPKLGMDTTTVEASLVTRHKSVQVILEVGDDGTQQAGETGER